jgi:hypothetical protein
MHYKHNMPSFPPVKTYFGILWPDLEYKMRPVKPAAVRAGGNGGPLRRRKFFFCFPSQCADAVPISVGERTGPCDPSQVEGHRFMLKLAAYLSIDSSLFGERIPTRDATSIRPVACLKAIASSVESGFFHG